MSMYVKQKLVNNYNRPKAKEKSESYLFWDDKMTGSLQISLVKSAYKASPLMLIT